MGCRIGYNLWEAGYEVLLVDQWQQHVQAIQNHGLGVITENGTKRAIISAVFPEQCKEAVDRLMIFTKATQTESMLQRCKHLINEKTYVMTLQNGLGNIDIILQYVKKDRLVAGITTYAAELFAPGKIKAFGTGYNKIILMTGKQTNKLKEIVNMMNQVKLNTEISEHILTNIWYKLAFNAVLNPLCTLMESTVASVGRYSNIQNVIHSIIDEIVLVAEKEGINLKREKILKMIEEVFPKEVSGDHFPSMLQDIRNRRKIEIKFLNGAIMKKGQLYNIPTPNNTLLYHLIKMKEECYQLND
ncbi:ketopantoate reductase family protein [Bacillus alveayuensis]|jgi:2-dehydropantoate 2-reductase|uniref:ketopantoate reductase family protein n=1 Tax=Aeribacillus alveayuensis TaxID=279215 RepID=UPI0005CD3203|nr:2-dehydropantoate 2-reductase [Bacillus alveayuensis]